MYDSWHVKEIQLQVYIITYHDMSTQAFCKCWHSSFQLANIYQSLELRFVYKRNICLLCSFHVVTVS